MASCEAAIRLGARLSFANTMDERSEAMRAEKWEPIDGIDRPCAQISFSYSPVHTATVSMRFDGLASGPPRDLILKFRQVIVLSGEEECPGGFVPAPAVQSLPKLERGANPSWTFPLLQLYDSEALNQYQMIFHQHAPNPPLAHFFLVSMHNLLHVIASADVHAAWNTRRETTEILMPLLNEGTDCWRPVSAKLCADGGFEILGIMPVGEEWQFAPGKRVRCQEKRFADGSTSLVALELLTDGQ